ncbi:LANO_0D03950g1_1 [Lachancea nothofagi CBS 11611]|uniref:LANO_0D03950g1_1 n=1 Tax=Lachancea nothofagi CBS 11611 TaxID=1266666 RepID=A0A1G4JG22_9SACH|nr:LANO_0D03950g1_1 [Lachancea nothofagi CBS 11611]
MPVIISDEQEIVLSHEQEDKLNEFQVITNFPDQELSLVVKLLQNHGWQLEPALCRYFDGNWQDNIEPPEVPQRSSTPLNHELISHSPSPFIMSSSALVPKLPLVKRLPLDFKEKFQFAGLDKRPHELDMNPGLLVLLLLPKLLLKLGTGILTIIWSIISFGLKNNQAPEANVCRLPQSPSKNAKPVNEIVDSLLGEKSELASLLDLRPFNELYDECERQFKFMLVICLGDLESEESGTWDQNSSKFVSSIFNDPSTLQLLRERSKDLTIFMHSAQSPEMWALANQLKLKYTPECLLIANVLNSKDSASATTRMSVVGRMKISSLRKFKNSLKMALDRHSAELLVSRTDQEELRIAREIKELQDQAYLESLKQDQVKEQKRQEDEKQTKLLLEAELSRSREVALNRTIQKLRVLECSLSLLNSQQLVDSNAKNATLQIRTSDGRRFIKKFQGDESLMDIYRAVKCFLFLELKTFEENAIMTGIKAKLIELAENSDELCFKDRQWPEGSLAGETSSSLHDIVRKELRNWCNSSEEIELDIDFELVSPYPRFLLPYDKAVHIKDTPQIWPNGSLLVEALQEEEGEDEADEKED